MCSPGGVLPSADDLIPHVYAMLQAQASSILGMGASLSPRSLVHDALLKLYRSDMDVWRDEAHFRAVAALAMRQIIIDRSRRAKTVKHGGGRRQVSLSGVGYERDPVELLALVNALESLEASNPRVARVVEYRLLGGMSIEQTAKELAISTSTAKREWRVGQAWMQRQLGQDG